MSSVGVHSDQGELKRALARQIGSDPARYADELGVERHRRLTDEEITRVCIELGMEFLREESNQDRRNAIMQKLGRDHRIGARQWDSSDLRAVVIALEEGITNV